MFSDIKWTLSTDTVVMAALVVGDAFNFFSANGPSYMTTKEFAAKKPQASQSIRFGYRIATVEALLIGGAITLYTKSWIPVTAAALGCAAMIVVYEHALQTGTGDGPGIADQPDQPDQQQSSVLGMRIG